MREALATLWWTVLPHPPHSPDLAPTDFLVFGSLMDALRGRRCAEEKLKLGVRRVRRIFSREFNATGICRRQKRWKSVLIVKDSVWEKNINFVKIGPVMNLCCVSIVTEVSEKQNSTVE